MLGENLGLEGANKTASSSSSSPAQAMNSFSIDNLNVIYDNDTAVTGLAYDELEGNTSKSQLLPIRNTSLAIDAQRETRRKHNANNIQSSFINSEEVEAYEANRQQENYAHCELAGESSGRRLGSLSFWQAKENRGATHLVARFRHQLSGIKSNNSFESKRLNRKRRESFNVPIERELPRATIDEPNQTFDGLVFHRIWLIQSVELSSCNLSSLQAENKTLISEIKIPTPIEDQLVDVDAETILGKNFHLAGEKSIVNKCLVLTVGDKTETSLASCKVIDSKSMAPKESEIDHLPSVSVLQPIREDLLLQQNQHSNGRRKV